MGAEDELMPTTPWAQQNIRQPHSKLLPGKKVTFMLQFVGIPLATLCVAIS